MARDLGVPYTDKQPYYFISYNSEDERRVSHYAAELNALGVPLWYDNGIKVGKAWETEIVDKMDGSQAVIMFLSKNIFQKENSYVHKEFELATEYFQKNIYIMMLDNIEKADVPNRFKLWWINVTKLQCINTFEYSSPKECIQKFLENLDIKIEQMVEDKPIDCEIGRAISSESISKVDSATEVHSDKMADSTELNTSCCEFQTDFDELLKLPNKVFAFKCLYILLNQNRSEDIKELTNCDFCKSRFGMRYPILTRGETRKIFGVPMYTELPSTKRYYSNPIELYGVKYWVCNDWYYNGKTNKRDTKTPFAKWVLGMNG